MQPRQNNPVRLVLFDVDGTLIRTGGAGVKAFGRTLELLFGVSDGTRGISFAGRTDYSLVREIFARHQIEPTSDHLASFFDAYVFLLDHLLQESQGAVEAGVWDWLRGLQRAPERMGVGLLTGNIRLGAEIKLRHYGLWDCFEIGGFADDHADRNRIAEAARRRGQALLGHPLADNQVLVIGDTPLDIACGKHIGARTLAVATGRHGLDELRDHQPDWAVANLSQMSVRCLWNGE
jgi:phosphoglycolate phosphatase